MIPRRIALSGFLCYRDEQVIELDGSDLWVFSGRNGSGKSAIFDAMTFALFGAHRGGKQNAANLINADSSELSVALDFDLGPERYRVRRSLNRKGSPSPQVYRYQPDGDGPGRWPAVPETDRIAGFNRWVQENLGLTYETFTASVLLLQGRAETLLGAQPKERFEILAGIVDLERYRRLHQQADARRQEAKARAEALRARLRSMPEVEPAAIDEAQAQLDAALRDQGEQEARWQRLVELEAQATTWRALADRRDEALRRHEHAQRLLHDAGPIQRDAARLRAIDAALPALREGIDLRAALATAKTNHEALQVRRKALTRRLDLLGLLADDQRRIRVNTAERASGLEIQRRAISDRLAALAAPIARARTARRQREQVERLEAALAAHPPGLEHELSRIEAEHHEHAQWASALPALRTIARERAELAALMARLASAEPAIGTLEAALRQAEATLAKARSDMDAAREAERLARDRLTRASTLLAGIDRRRTQFETLKGAPSCDRCGQPLTPEHYQAERHRLDDERDRLAGEQREAGEELRASQARREQAEAAFTAAERAVAEMSQAISDARRDLDQARRDAQRHEHRLREAFEHLDGPARLAVAPEAPANWLETTFPTPDDLDAASRRKTALPRLAARLESIRSQLAAFRNDQTRLEQARLSLAAVGAQADDDQAEAEQGRLVRQSAAIDDQLAGLSQAQAVATETLQRLEAVGQDARDRLADAARRLAVEQARIDSLGAALTRGRAALDEAWRPVFDEATAGTLGSLEAERDALRSSGVERRAEELPQAQEMLQQARDAAESIERQMAEFPREAQAPAETIAAQKASAAEALRASDERRRAGQSRLDGLLRDQKQRQECEALVLAAEAERSVAETLANLLGRDGLQRELLRAAERGILDCANPILAEISGGELELRLAGGDASGEEQALQLTAVVRTHGRSVEHDVAYLSGSQKFRVAVSLALGIGQYARGLHRPIESVIIDEGFGCLDRQGRQEMIDELTALKGRLARILLVSHQEEFADAFPDGYRFEVVAGATVTQPVRR
jgi:exonuclease SbcC